jgi:hypothetical protein
MSAGWEWMTAADAVVVYTDRGISSGMQAAINRAMSYNIPVERRSIIREELAAET